MSREAVRSELVRHGLAPRRAHGQNFLVDEGVAERIAEAAGLAPGETALEVGTGLGILTRALARRAGRVVTLEIDAGLFAALAEPGALPEHVERLHADALRVDLAALAGRERAGTRGVANLPYAISSPLLRRLLDARGVLRGWTVMLQREVAQRLLAAPGSRDYGSLTVLHHLTTRVERCFDVPASAFHPAPRVTSTVIRVTPLTEPRIDSDELIRVERVVRAAFSQRRKTLLNALRSGLRPARDAHALRAGIEQAGLDPRVRAEALAPEQLLTLARTLHGGSP